MSRFVRLVLPLALVALAAPVFAGGPDCDHNKASAAGNVAHASKKCDMTAEDCKKWMAEAKTRGWLGIEMESNEADGSWIVSKVVPSSPAEKAGFRQGDVVLALNGVTLNEENHEKLFAIKKGFKPGDQVTYNVRRDGAEKNVTAVLATMPDEVYTAWVEKHLKEHAELAAR